MELCESANYKKYKITPTALIIGDFAKIARKILLAFGLSQHIRPMQLAFDAYMLYILPLSKPAKLI